MDVSQAQKAKYAGPKHATAQIGGGPEPGLDKEALLPAIRENGWKRSRGYRTDCDKVTRTIERRADEQSGS